MWNDRETPIGYLITFRCHGTWLHGDIRGSVDRTHNIYLSPRLEHVPARKGYVKSIAKHAPVYLDAHRRSCVERAIRDTCLRRGWHIYALNVRTNHIHVVVSAGSVRPDLMLNALKANATRQMREEGLWDSDRSPWAEKGSKRWLWKEINLSNAIEYVMNGQGDELPRL